MLRDDLKLSDIGLKMFDAAIMKIREEIKQFQRIRTVFFYPLKKDDDIDSIELRAIIDAMVEEYKLKFPFKNRDSLYSNFIATKAFDVFKMKIHRLSPENYLIVTQKKDGPILVIIRDTMIPKESNLKIAFLDNNLDNTHTDLIPSHLSIELMEAE